MNGLEDVAEAVFRRRIEAARGLDPADKLLAGSSGFLSRVPSYFQSLEHLPRYCARSPFALERISVIRAADGRIARIRYVMTGGKSPHKAAPPPISPSYPFDRAILHLAGADRPRYAVSACGEDRGVSPVRRGGTRPAGISFPGGHARADDASLGRPPVPVQESPR